MLTYSFDSEPQNYMFSEMRSALGIPKSQDILDHVYSLPTQEDQHQAMELIRNIERTAYVHPPPPCTKPSPKRSTKAFEPTSKPSQTIHQPPQPPSEPPFINPNNLLIIPPLPSL
jgi:hypothetical protein